MGFKCSQLQIARCKMSLKSDLKNPSLIKHRAQRAYKSGDSSSIQNPSRIWSMLVTRHFSCNAKEKQKNEQTPKFPCEAHPLCAMPQSQSSLEEFKACRMYAYKFIVTISRLKVVYYTWFSPHGQRELLAYVMLFEASKPTFALYLLAYIRPDEWFNWTRSVNDRL